MTVFAIPRARPRPAPAPAADVEATAMLGEHLRKAIPAASAAAVAALANADKAYVRALHLHAKRIQARPPNVARLFKKHSKRFRAAVDINPHAIAPVLRLVTDDEAAELFLLVRSCWSMPYNKGYGRRLRFVVFDAHHEAVIGVIGLQSPPSDLAARDDLFHYPTHGKLSMVNNTLDAYAVGAVPPYSQLLGGKLCAGMISTDTVRRAYWRQYAGGHSEMLARAIQQPLVAVTTTSAFGRSSMYNRLRFHERTLAEPVGFTAGFGTVHLEELYPQICDYLKGRELFTPGGYGNGPKVRWQNICRALKDLGLPNALLQHGVRREVFLFRLVEDLERGMSGGRFGPPLNLAENDFADYWRERYAIPRSVRDDAWKAVDGDTVRRMCLGT